MGCFAALWLARSEAMLLQFRPPIPTALADTSSARSQAMSRNRRRRPRHVRKPCSGRGRLEKTAMTRPSVLGPIDAPQRRKRSGATLHIAGGNWACALNQCRAEGHHIGVDEPRRACRGERSPRCAPSL